MPAIRELMGKMPILGVCLGHQSIGAALGGKIVRAQRQMHGKSSTLSTDQLGVYQGLPKEFSVVRYHSLVIDRESCPPELIVTSTSGAVALGTVLAAFTAAVLVSILVR